MKTNISLFFDYFNFATFYYTPTKYNKKKIKTLIIGGVRVHRALEKELVKFINLKSIQTKLKNHTLLKRMKFGNN